MAYIFLRKSEILALHAGLIETSGGAYGIRSEGGLESALAAAENRYLYEDAGLTVCAATYAYHLTQSHAFIDGNKRVGAAAAEAFVMLNNGRLDATNDELLELLLAVASGDVSRAVVEDFFAQHTSFD